MPRVVRTLTTFLEGHPEASASVSLQSIRKDGVGGTRLLGLMDEKKFRRVLSKMLDESELLGRFGIRSVSCYHLDHRYAVTVCDEQYRVQYVPAESDTAMFGGNSNWRGPIWMPINVLIIRALVNLYQYYGNDFHVECPTSSGRLMDLFKVAQEIANRLIRISWAMIRAAALFVAVPRSFRRAPTGGTTFSSTSIFMATTAPESRRAIRRVGRVWLRT